MTLPTGPILRRKLVLVKLLYQQAEKQSVLRHSVVNRIMAIIGFDLAVETLLKICLGSADPRQSITSHLEALFDRCNTALTDHALSSLPFRAFILRMRKIRNDAQHEAKYPNETDLDESRTYAREFCTQVMLDVWGISYDTLSLLELIDSNDLRHLLEVSGSAIQAHEYKKALTLAEATFYWASKSISNFLPRIPPYHFPQLTKTEDRLAKIQSALKDPDRPRRLEFASRELDEFGEELSYILSYIQREGHRFSALLSTGINLVDYRRYRDSTVQTHFTGSHDVSTDKRSRRISANYGDRKPTEQDALWVHSFVVDSIIQWQTTGLDPSLPDDPDTAEYAQILLDWDDGVSVT